MSRRGVTLVEMLVVAGLFSLIIGIGATNFHDAPRQASTRSGAELLASEFRYARAEAVRRHTPVALCLPSNNGSQAASKGIYWLVGDDKPRITKALDLAQQGADAAYFRGIGRSIHHRWPTRLL